MKVRGPAVTGELDVADGGTTALRCGTDSTLPEDATIAYAWTLNGALLDGVNTQSYTTTTVDLNSNYHHTCTMTVNGVPSDDSPVSRLRGKCLCCLSYTPNKKFKAMCR